jgi:hypothetical protein
MHAAALAISNTAKKKPLLRLKGGYFPLIYCKKVKEKIPQLIFRDFLFYLNSVGISQTGIGIILC